MNAVEIEEAVSALAEQPFDRAEFPYAFLAAFGNKDTTLKRLRSGASNKSDLGGVLQTNNIHIATCDPGQVTATLQALKASPATARGKAKFILATDGDSFEAEDLASGETVACTYREFPDHFGFFLPLAGITTVKQIRESSFDIKATGRLNRLYVQLLKENPEWGTAARRPDMNHFMARLIFCFFAEDTDIFCRPLLFTSTVQTMSASDSSNTHEVISTIFRAMNVKIADRAAAGIPRWADQFPYVNGGLFSGSPDVPRFSRIARSYLLHIGSLDWKRINPDIFGSMIQAVAEDEERGALGMHYTSVPNILKVLNPLFLDDLREKLEEAGGNPRKLLNLRNRMARIRVFDPACGSGNFLVIAYKEMRAIEAEINKRRGEADRRTEIPVTNFRGIEIRDFPAEIARLALIIAEYQCDVVYRGQKEALQDFLPLRSENWITCGNALTLDWLSICPPTGTGVKLKADDLFSTPMDQAQIDFDNQGGETYICGNPPYLGSKWQSTEQKEELEKIFSPRTKGWKSVDYVAGWMMKAAEYGRHTRATSAFVTTNSICQGLQVPILWPAIFQTGSEIAFAHTSFRWANLASNNAGVTVCIVGISASPPPTRRLFYTDELGNQIERKVNYINAYLVAGPNIIIEQMRRPISSAALMLFGNMPRDGGNLILGGDERRQTLIEYPDVAAYIRPYYGSEEMINGKLRWCIWIDDDDAKLAEEHPFLSGVLERVKESRLKSDAQSTREFAQKPHRFVQIAGRSTEHCIAIAKVSSERRPYIPVDLLNGRAIPSDLLFAMYDAEMWNLALVASRLHLVWAMAVCGKLETRLRYSNTLGWNTFPVPTLTEKNKVDLSVCAEDILLAREAHFPATIADLYDPDAMPVDLRAAHDRNDEVLERIYIGRRFKNDTERLEKLFELYTKITKKVAA
ncbi:class I SAM-dependent DNA methyltransferase [Neoroseomonas soli]|uniref:site-specific DNA-methyltransferase (adenine-specific) n=1 Tax=Neoroseomonas soli TaxID=1081025 RepID=A0A9X9WS02_9PROT|nr:class I SAM-dependent DNA methyltransferase [Neoroseomonas soli]MBR0669931.1 class I SAM-dependent DNA methyltransferase [Neoroseomonas soli]